MENSQAGVKTRIQVSLPDELRNLRLVALAMLDCKFNVSKSPDCTSKSPGGGPLQDATFRRIEKADGEGYGKDWIRAV